MPSPADHSLALRSAVVRKVLAATAVRSKLGDRFYGRRVPANPSWPFGRYGVPIVAPFEAQGQGGSDSDITLHVFARGPDEEACALIAADIVAALSDDELDLADGLGLVSLDWSGTQILEDGEEGADYHAVIRFSVVTTE